MYNVFDINKTKMINYDNKEIREYNTLTGKSRLLYTHKEWITNVMFSKDETKILSWDSSEVKLYNLKDETIKIFRNCYNGRVSKRSGGVSLSNSERYLLVCNGNVVEEWNIETEEVVRYNLFDSKEWWEVAKYNKDETMILASDGFTIVEYDKFNNDCKEFTFREDIMEFFYSSDETKVIVFLLGGIVKICDLSKNKIVKSYSY